METRSTILNELNGISSAVAQVGTTLPYQVPDGYFEGLAQAILQRIKTEGLNAAQEVETLSPLLAGLNKKMPFSVPDDYFTELSGNVVGGVKAIDFVHEELEIMSPMMQELRHKNVYEVPQGYFENLAANVLGKVAERKPAKLVSMNAGRRLMRYAVAAVITGAIAIGGWFYFNNEGTTGADPQVATAIEKISDDSKVSEEEMANYLETETLPVAINTAANEEMDATDLKEMLADATEDELQQFITTL